MAGKVRDSLFESLNQVLTQKSPTNRTQNGLINAQLVEMDSPDKAT